MPRIYLTCLSYINYKSISLIFHIVYITMLRTKTFWHFINDWIKITKFENKYFKNSGENSTPTENLYLLCYKYMYFYNFQGIVMLNMAVLMY